jgi:hypothetical protein
MVTTLHVYWTRTPQYTLLHVLDAYSRADHEGVTAYIEKEQPLKRTLRVKGERESVVQYLARLQNKTLERGYRVTVEESRINGKIATLRVKVDETAYRLTFLQQMNGRWKLIDFQNRDAFSEQAVKGMKDHPLLIIATL